MLAACYYQVESEEDGRKKNLQKALECWQKIVSVKDNDAWNEKTIKMAELHVKYLPAIIKGDFRAMLELGKSLLELQPEFTHLDGDSHCTVVDICSVGWSWLKEAGSAIAKGDYSVGRDLAELYWKMEDEDKAIELWKKMADDGDGWSLYKIGKCYLDGDGVKKDEEEAKRLLEQAAAKGVEKAKKALSTISDSVKDKDKGPSGIVVGKTDKGSLPKFVCEDYKNAELGKPALKVPEKKSSSGSVKASTKKRWKFVVLGLLLGFFGIHLAYAKRWVLFLLLWAGFITGNVMSDPKKETANVSNEAVTQVQPESKSGNDSSSPLSGIGFAMWGLLWIGGTLFIKKDGKGNRM
jgi:TPR repeat protein